MGARSGRKELSPRETRPIQNGAVRLLAVEFRNGRTVPRGRAVCRVRAPVVAVSFFGPPDRRVGEIIVLEIDSDMNNTTPRCRTRVRRKRCCSFDPVASPQSFLSFKTIKKTFFVPPPQPPSGSVAGRSASSCRITRVSVETRTERPRVRSVRRAPCEADTMSHGQFKFERKSGGVSRKLKQAGNVCRIREFELEKVNKYVVRGGRRCISGRRIFTRTGCASTSKSSGAEL